MAGFFVVGLSIFFLLYQAFRGLIASCETYDKVKGEDLCLKYPAVGILLVVEPVETTL